MLLLLLIVSLLPQQQTLPRAEEILDNVEAIQAKVSDYVVTLEGEVRMEGVKVPKTVIEMYFKRPGKLHFESSSFSMVPRDGLSLDPSELRRTYDAKTVALIDSGGRRWYKLQLAAKESKTRLRQAYLYVDAATWTIRRLESTPYEGRTISFEFEYAMVDGAYLLPSSVTAMFGSVGPKTEDIFKIPEDAPSPAPQFREMQRMVRNGTVHFVYRNYRVNTGLSDSLFTPSR